MIQKIKMYRRKLLGADGTLFEGRWTDTKENYMTSAKYFVKEVVAMGPWEVKIFYLEKVLHEDEL